MTNDSGEPVHIHSPRVRLLLRAIERDAIEIPDEAVQLIAATTYSDQSLVAVLRYLVTQALQQGIELTTDFVKEELDKI